jgi:UDP-N-acetylglucosamine 3-dehydrogenase
MSAAIGLVGLGAMGRHHARLLDAVPDAELVGAVDPKGDRFDSLRGVPLLASVDELLDLGVDGVVVAVPTADHEAIATRLAERGVSALIEKPLAADSASAGRIVESYRKSKARAVVGHVERFNPALRELKKHLDEESLGRVFWVATERVGPFPNRIADVGVVKDLATHDIDIVSWITGNRFTSVAARATHKMGREHEDLVSIVGGLSDDSVATLQVNWLTPVKRRTVTVVGEAGAYVADLLTADLYFHANSEVPAEWDALARVTGVSEGDMVRYAIPKPEPLRSQLDAFLRWLDGEETDLVALEEGAAVLDVAEAILRSARNETTETL